MTSEDVDRMLAAHDIALRKIEDGLVAHDIALRKIEDGHQKVQDAQLVTQRLMELYERQWDERFARLEAKVESHEDGIAEMRAAMNKLFDRMDRFIQGLERENGNKN